MQKKVLAWCRVSSERQELDAQIRELREFILKEFNCSEEEIEWVVRKVSSTQESEKEEYEGALNEMKNICLQKNIRNVAVWHINRLGRLELILNSLKIFFEKNKIQFVCRTPYFKLLNNEYEIDFNSDLMYAIHVAMVKGDNLERQKKFARGKEEVRLRGGYRGGRLLFGYGLNENNIFIVNPEEAKIVRKIFDLYLTKKHSCRSISKELNLKEEYHRGKSWTPNEINDILKNVNYLGRTEGMGNLYPRIIEPDIFNTVKELLSSNRTLRSCEYKNIHLANSLIRCTVCGRRYVADVRQYSCVARKCSKSFHIEEPCSAPTVNKKILDIILWNSASILYMYDIIRNKDNEEINLANELTGLSDKITNLKKELKKLDLRKEEADNNYYAKGILDEKRYTAVLKNIKGIEDKLNAEIIDTDNRIKVLKRRSRITEIKNEYQKFLKLFDQLGRYQFEGKDGELCRDIIRTQISEIRIEKDNEYTIVNLKLFNNEVIKFRYHLKTNFKDIRESIWIFDKNSNNWVWIAKSINHFKLWFDFFKLIGYLLPELESENPALSEIRNQFGMIKLEDMKVR